MRWLPWLREWWPALALVAVLLALCSVAALVVAFVLNA